MWAGFGHSWEQPSLGAAASCAANSSAADKQRELRLLPGASLPFQTELHEKACLRPHLCWCRRRLSLLRRLWSHAQLPVRLLPAAGKRIVLAL